ncbi:hypothetical protein [Streptomyces filamentosus]|uniref:hypothetical protein n=1 Tax=Streptomyces filamentosus TaxID=67294 RepID=UPI0033F05FFD
MALYILKEINPNTGRAFLDDDTTAYFDDDDFNGNALEAAQALHSTRIAQSDEDWGPGVGATRWKLYKVTPKPN